jgi:hypothetical protein
MDQVISAFKAKLERMGAFPLPTPTCVRAAEILKDHLAAMPAACAVNVVEIVSRGIRRYVVANSSRPNLVHEFLSTAKTTGGPSRLTEANVELASAIGSGAAFHIVRTGFDFYEPANEGIMKLFRAVNSNFDGEKTLIDLSNVRAAIAGFKEAFIKPKEATTYNPTGKTKGEKSIVSEWSTKAKVIRESNKKAFEDKILSDKELQLTPKNFKGEHAHVKQQFHRFIEQTVSGAEEWLKRVLTCAAAFRLRMVGEDRGLVRDELRRFRQAMSTDTGRSAAWLKSRMPIFDAIEGHIKAMMEYGPEIVPVKPGNSTTFDELDAAIGAVWDEIFRSRFCAEPRAFAFLSGRQYADGAEEVFPAFTIASQTCFWICGTEDKRPNPKEYQVIGPEENVGDGSQTGSYMWPCSSCRNRSKLMLSGLVQREAPYEV